jgi:hypothetical protein
MVVLGHGLVRDKVVLVQTVVQDGELDGLVVGGVAVVVHSVVVSVTVLVVTGGVVVVVHSVVVLVMISVVTGVVVSHGVVVVVGVREGVRVVLHGVVDSSFSPALTEATRAATPKYASKKAFILSIFAKRRWI